LVHSEPAQDFSSIIESLIPDGEKELVKRQQQTKDERDNEEINELSRLQDPAVTQDPPQVGGAISDGDSNKENLNSPGGHAQVPSDQKETGSNALANISEFLRNKEGDATIPVNGDFTLWTPWSTCPDACGRTALRSRERYCTNPAPANGGKNCEGPRFQLKLCKIKQCAVNGGFSSWSHWSHCSQKCGQGMKHRRRYCNNPKPANGGQTCKGSHKQAKPCYGRRCQDQDSIVDIDPQTVCGYNPCAVAKCILLPYATCVSDFKCRPVFFDSEERKVPQCSGDNLYLNVNAQTVCRFDPCKYTTCLQGTAAKCVVNTRCHPVFLDAFGKIMKCKGVFKVPARYICGYDPCSGATCTSDPTARCLVDHTCKSMFVNAYNQKTKGCRARHHIIKDDEDGEQVSEDENASDDEDQLNKLVDSKLNGDDKDTDSEDEDDADDDGARLRKLMRSAKLSTREKSNNNDDDDDDDDDDNQKSKDSEEGVESIEDNSDNEIVAKLLKSKLRGKEKINYNKDDDDDDDDDDSLQTEDKLASSKEDASDENSDGDDDNIDANNSNETDDNKKRSKFPLRFKPPKLKDTHKKVKKSRFRHPKKKPKHLKSKHKRWLETAS
ncbi:unnamed protein product, partial [Porites lobata]